MENILWLGWLYKFDAKGVLKRWRCGTQGDKFYAEYGTMWLTKGGEGKLRRTPLKVIASNARESNSETQAQNYAKQEWEDKIRRDAYHPSDTIPTCSALEWAEMHQDNRHWPAVCLAWKDASESEKDCTVKRPWIAQHKIDGNRCTAWYTEDEIQLYSRKCLPLEFKDHLREQLIGIFHLIHYIKTGKEEHFTCYDFGIDGEIWNPKLGSHQQSHSISSRTVNRHKDEKDQCFAWFDIIDYTLTAQERFNLMKRVIDFLREFGDDLNTVAEVIGMDQRKLCIGGDFANIFPVPYKIITDVDELQEYYQYSLQMQFEGVVLRRLEHMYPTARERKTSQMIKMKPFEDAEFEIVGFKQGEADRDGCVVWLCRNDLNDETFSTQQMGDVTYQRELFDSAEEYIGKKITIRFDGRSDKKIPVKPRAIRVRDKGDLP
jgi:ATP-dependent DNA ligase